MKKTLLALSLLASASVFAQSQADITRAAYARADRAGVALNKAIEARCSQAESVKEWGDGTGASAAFAGCLTTVKKDLLKYVKTMNVK